MDKRDCALINVFWMYGSGLITKKLFHQSAEKLKYDMIEERDKG